MIGNTIPKEAKKEKIDSFLAETWKVCLLTNAFNTVATPYLYSGVSAYEVASGSGYTTGGEGVSKLAWGIGSGYTDTNNAYIDAVDATWYNATFTFRYVVVYETTGGKIRGIYDLGYDWSPVAKSFTIQWNAGGLIKIS